MATNNDLNSSNNNKKSIIEFLPFSTLIDSSFWFEIKRIKLDVLKLSTTPIDICPSFSVHTNIPGIVTLNYEAFESYDKLCTRREHTDLDEDLFYLNGQLIIYNTRDEFETTDKHVLINQQGKLVSIFLLVFFCNVKKIMILYSNQSSSSSYRFGTH